MATVVSTFVCILTVCHSLKVYHCFGPKVSPFVTVFLMAVPSESMVSNTCTLPHHCGTVTSGSVIAKKMINVAMMSPESSAAAVM